MAGRPADVVALQAGAVQLFQQGRTRDEVENWIRGWWPSFEIPEEVVNDLATLALLMTVLEKHPEAAYEGDPSLTESIDIVRGRFDAWLRSDDV
jgi:hypothetical protein